MHTAYFMGSNSHSTNILKAPIGKRNLQSVSFPRLAKLSLLAILLGHGQDCQAVRTGAGVVRVDLQKQLVQRPTASFSADDEDLLLSIGEMENNYAHLRDMQNLHI